MAKKSKRHHKKDKAKHADPGEVDVAVSNRSQPKMKKKEYEQHMRVLQGELVAMQEWVRATGAKVCIVFEGLDSAGKGAATAETRRELVEAMLQIAQTGEGPREQTPSIGCSIKWKTG